MKTRTTKITGLLALVSLFAVLAVPAEAKGRNDANRRAAEQARKEQARREKERADRKKDHDQLSGFMKPRDANDDGSLTREEFLSKESDKAAGEKKFAKFNKNNDRFLSKSEIEDLLGQ